MCTQIGLEPVPMHNGMAEKSFFTEITLRLSNGAKD